MSEWRSFLEIIDMASRPVNQRIEAAEPVVSKNERSGGVQWSNEEGEDKGITCQIADGKINSASNPGMGEPSIRCSRQGGIA